MKESKCRFIEEYANFQIKQYKKDAALFDYDEERNAFFDEAVMNIEKAVKMARAGRITVNECMDIISHPMEW